MLLFRHSPVRRMQLQNIWQDEGNQVPTEMIRKKLVDQRFAKK